MAKKLTSRAIETLEPGTVRREIPDGLLAGLYLIVQPSGAKSWAIRYRFKGNPRKFTLGSWPVVDLAGARELGQKALIAAKRGDDPGAQKKAERRAAGPAERDDFAKIGLEFIERYARPNTREATWRETARILGFEVDPENPKLLRPTPTGGEVCKWRGKTVHEITRRDVLDLLDRIVDRGSPVTANRTLAAIRRLFSWCIERDILRASPCAGVKPPTSERSRDRVLADDEIRAVWQACDKVGWPFAPIVKLLILTAQRRDEVAEMRWPEIDFKARTWTLAREHQAHFVPLSDAAIKMLESLPRIGGDAGFIFTTTGCSPVSGFSRAKLRINESIAESAKAALAHWTFHDLRRTTASGMARLGINLPVIEKILNHSSGSFAGIVGVYQHYNFSDEKKMALETWGKFVEQLVGSEPPTNVTELARSRQ